LLIALCSKDEDVTTSSRTRKTTQPTEETDALAEGPEPTESPGSEETSAAPVVDQVLVPSATPLDAPTPPAEVPTQDEPELIAVADAIPNLSINGLIVDAETVTGEDPIGRPPADLSAVFVKASPTGSEGIALLRLLEHTTAGPHQTQMTRLLVAKGTRLSGQTIAEILQRLEDQAGVRDVAGVDQA